MLQRYCGLIDETQRFLGAVLCEDAKARNLECGDKSRAVRGSRHRFCAQHCRRTLLKKRHRAEYRLPPHSKFFNTDKIDI